MTRRREQPAEARPTPAQQAIKQTQPFRSLRHEAMVGLLLTAEAVKRPMAELLGQHGDLTLQQYNVLRILRGAGPDGLPTLEVATRMIERTPGITRLIDRLEHKALVTRERSAADRRQVVCRLTPAGERLLAKLDAPVAAIDEAALGGLDDRQTRTLIRLLDRVRAHASDTLRPTP